jgi:hypothetical protein
MPRVEQVDSRRIGSDYAFFELFVVLVSPSLRLLGSGSSALLSNTNLLVPSPSPLSVWELRWEQLVEP